MHRNYFEYLKDGREIQEGFGMARRLIDDISSIIEFGSFLEAFKC